MSAGAKAKRRAWFTDYIAKQIVLLESIDSFEFEEACKIIEDCRTRGNQIFVVGNGGSAANASHFAQDLGKGASDALQKDHGAARFRIQSLGDNVSWITALGNDYSYDEIFSKQLEAHGKKNDVVIGISVSGTSQNVYGAIGFALDNEMKSIALIGSRDSDGEESINQLSDVTVRFADSHFGRVEDAMMTFLHTICYCYMEAPEQS